MTGSVDDQDEKLVRAIRGRAFYFIQKPFDREVLQTLVERCLELRWRREENRRHVQRLETELGRGARVSTEPAAAARRQARRLVDLLPIRRRAPSSVATSTTTRRRSGARALLYRRRLRPRRLGGDADRRRQVGVPRLGRRRLRAAGRRAAAVDSLAAFGPERFVTLIAAVLGADEGRLHYVNAGHPPALVWNGAGSWIG